MMGSRNYEHMSRRWWVQSFFSCVKVPYSAQFYAMVVRFVFRKTMASLKLCERDAHNMKSKPKIITESQRYLIYDHPSFSFDVVNNWKLQLLLWKSIRASDVVIGTIISLFIGSLVAWLLTGSIYTFFTLGYFACCLWTYVHRFVRRRVQREYHDVTVVGTAAEPNENLAEEILDDPKFPPNETIDDE